MPHKVECPFFFPESYNYDAYGNVLNHTFGATSSPQTNHLYTGEQYDTDLCMTYLRARYYDSHNGCFTQLDLYGGSKYEPLSLHKYAYVHNDPTNLIDPSGLTSLTELQTVSGISSRIVSIVGRIKKVHDWAIATINTIETLTSIFRIFSTTGQTLLARGLNVLLDAAKRSHKFMRVLTWDFLNEALENLQNNQWKLLGAIVSGAKDQRFINFMQDAMSGRDARILFMMPTPPSPRQIPNPLLLVETGLRFKIGKVNTRVSLYFGAGNYRGRYFGLGVVPDRNSRSLRAPRQLFRMDWHEEHKQYTGQNDWKYWVSDQFHYHVLAKREELKQ